MRSKLYFISVCLLLCFQTVAEGSTGVGNGGDIVSSYLEKTRYTLRQTIEVVTKDTPGLCESLIHLTVLQKKECKAFILETVNQYLALNSGDQRTQFLIRSEPLEVLGPDGKLRQVSARTPLGAEGPIEFHLDSIKNYSPAQTLALLGHEFGHKVLFRSRYIEDNLPTESFLSGRELLDSVGQALANFASTSGFVGKYYGISDQFDCRVQVRPDLPPSRIMGLTPRSFFEQNSFDRFESTIGTLPNDLYVEAGETWDTQIFLRATFHEEKGCKASGTQGRWTRLELVRTYENHGGATPEDEILVSDFRDLWNPLCEENRLPFKIDYGQFKFTCQYLGTVADQRF